MTVLQEPVQVKTHLHLVVTSGEPSIYDVRVSFSAPASAAGPVRCVRAGLPKASSAVPMVLVLNTRVIAVRVRPSEAVWVKNARSSVAVGSLV